MPPRRRKKSGSTGGTIKPSRPFTLIKGSERDPIIKRIMKNDMEGRHSPLELMKYYSDILSKQSSYGGIDKKLDALFYRGKTPRSMD
ncbi:MAG: hypothetical protein V3V95_07670, partial [Thermodesulfobacteriota bacterium]